MENITLGGSGGGLSTTSDDSTDSTTSTDSSSGSTDYEESTGGLSTSDPSDEPRIDLGDAGGTGGQTFSPDENDATQPDTPDQEGETVVAPNLETEEEDSVVHTGGETIDVDAGVQETTDAVQEAVGGGSDQDEGEPNVPDQAREAPREIMVLLEGGSSFDDLSPAAKGMVAGGALALAYLLAGG